MSDNHCPGCQCDRTLNDADLKQMYAAGQYEEINSAFEAGRFKFTDNNTDQ